MLKTTARRVRAWESRQRRALVEGLEARALLSSAEFVTININAANVAKLAEMPHMYVTMVGTVAFGGKQDGAGDFRYRPDDRFCHAGHGAQVDARA